MKKYLQAVIDYIDNNMAENITLDGIADHIGFSKYYLNQMFKVYTGYSIMTYTRLKKLEYSIELLQTNLRIVDVALEVGYSSERAYSRALVNTYGHPPSYFRNTQILKSRQLVIYDLELSVNENTFYDYFPHYYNNIVNHIKKEGVNNIMKYLSDISYVIIEPMTVISGIKEGSEPENEIVDLMLELTKDYGLTPLRSFGFDSPVEGEKDPIVYRGYEFWHSLSEEDLIKLPSTSSFMYKDTEIVIKRIPKHRYATLRITEPFVDVFERITGGWRVLHSWLEDHDFKEPDYKHITDGYCLEEVKEIDGISVMDIYTPVE